MDFAIFISFFSVGFASDLNRVFKPCLIVWVARRLESKRPEIHCSLLAMMSTHGRSQRKWDGVHGVWLGWTDGGGSDSFRYLRFS